MSKPFETIKQKELYFYPPPLTNQQSYKQTRSPAKWQGKVVTEAVASVPVTSGDIRRE